MNVTRRWRLLLGRYAEGDLPLSSEDQEVEDALSYLYDREYEMRGHRRVRPDGGGTLDPSHPMGLHWLKRSREIFPASALERMERDAIAEYGINELLGDPQVVETVHASPDLAAVLLRTRGSLAPETSDGVRALIAKVIAEIMERLRPQFTTALTGSTALRRRSHHASLRNLDWRGTIAANLKNVDPQSGTMLVSDVRFLAGKRRRNLNWQVTLLVDQSASMADSVLHSAISAAIIAGLPGITVRLLLFDTSVVDMSYLAEDPIEVLMTSQLGAVQI